MKKSLLLALVITTLLALLCGTAQAATSGQCGKDLTWYISGPTLYISGTGPMYDYGQGTSSLYGNTPFTDVLPDKYSERIESLLAVTGLQSRILKSYTDFDSPALPIDFDKVNERLASERKESLDCLKHMIED